MRRLMASLSVTVSILFCFTPLHARWVEDGAGIATGSPNQTYPQAVSDGEGGAIIVWGESEGGQYHYVQRVSPYGVPMWTAGGVQLCPSSSYNYGPIAIVPDGAGGAIVAWRDGRIPEGIYAQRVDRDGSILWDPAGVPVCTASGYQQNPQMASDGAGGAYIVWKDDRGTDTDIYAQRIDASGTTLWAADGMAVCTATGDQIEPQIAADAFRAYITWQDNRTGDYDIYVQRLYNDGAPQWTADGVLVCGEIYNQEYPDVIPAWYGGVIVAWQDWRDGVSPAVYMQHLNDVGSAQWITDGRAVSSLGGYQVSPKLVWDGTTAGSVVVWEQEGGGSRDIYAQRFNGFGAEQWTTDGVPVCTAYSAQKSPKITRDDEGGFFIAWYDQRSPYEIDVYAQKLDSGGAAQWEADGVAVCSALLSQYDQRIVPDGARGAIVVWKDYRSGSGADIYAQRIEENGYWGYPAPDIYLVRDVPGDQGGSMTAAWYPSRLDPLPEGLITDYTVWRAIDESQALLAARGGAPMLTDPGGFEPDAPLPAIRSQQLDGETYFWELVGSVDAYHLASYSRPVPTLFDSTEACTDRHYVQVIAHTADSRVFWVSAPDSGRSVDNLAPAVPVGLAGEQRYTPAGLELTWDPNGEGDLSGYAIYRGTDPGFNPGPGNHLVSTPDTLYLDDTWDWEGGFYYKVAAVDIHGNESGYALLSPDALTGDDTPGTPLATYLGQNYPNPFNPATRIEFGLEAPAHVRIRVYDAAGHLVRELADEALRAGVHVRYWDGRNRTGAAVSSGIYFYRLDAGPFSETRKMVLIR